MTGGPEVFSTEAGPRRRSLAAAVEERFLVPAYSSRWRLAPIAVHRSLALPLQLAGKVHRWRIDAPGGTVEVVGIGREKLIAPICTRLFGALPPPHREAPRSVLDPGYLAETDADLVVAEVHPWMAPRFQRAGWLLVPEAVRWQGDLASVPPAVPSHSLRKDLRKVRNNGFTIEHTTARADWDEFFTTMVRPQAYARHGESAWVPSLPLMRRFERSGTLHLVSHHGRRVAGVCSIGHGSVLWLPVSGVRDGDRLLLKQGALVAALGLTFEWARSQGYLHLDLGRTGAFLNDGIQNHKRKWGLLPVPDPLAHVAAVLVRCASVRKAFSREPVLVQSGAGLRVYAGESA
ncbi:MAG: GNAT family N-acetyltransferase [Gemmatimonadota bacterium]|nr:GNAT family N-acetyltransferase [Gemmatimonadota bacterium]